MNNSHSVVMPFGYVHSLTTQQPPLPIIAIPTRDGRNRLCVNFTNAVPHVLPVTIMPEQIIPSKQ